MRIERWHSLVGVGAVTLCTCFVPVQAQSPPGGQQPAQPDARTPGSATSERKGEITVTGCLQRADPGRPGPATQSPSSSSSAGTAAAGGGFVLENASMAGSMGPGSSPRPVGGESGAAAGPGGARGTTAGDGMARELRLIATAAGVKLEEHVGHQVEVRGTYAHGSAGEPPRGTGIPTTGGTPGSPTTTAATPRDSGQGTSPGAHPAGAGHGGSLVVSSIRMIAATCTPKSM